MAASGDGDTRTAEPGRAAGRSRLSVIVPLRNELARLPAVLAGLEAQQRRPDEVVVADGMSTDGSREWLAAAARNRPWLTVVDNAAGTVPAALNAALAASTGDLVARMDTHADYSPDYLACLVDFLDRHPGIAGVGGAMNSSGRGPWGHAIAAVLRRPLGMGGARHRCGGAEGPVEHVFTGCYRRSALEAIGGFDERLLANEDYEADVRLRQHGEVVWLHPPATCTWYVRECLPSLVRQMWRYGHYKALTLNLHPHSLQARQLAPPALVLGLLVPLVLRPRTGMCVTVLYAAGSGVAGALAARSDGTEPWRGAVVTPLVHLSWGAGLLTGLARFARAPSRPHARGTGTPDGGPPLRVLLVGQAAPARGGIPSFLGALARDDGLAGRADVRLLSTTRRAERRVGTPTARNALHAVIDAYRSARAARDRDVVHLLTVLLSGLPLVRALTSCAAARWAGAATVCHVRSAALTTGRAEALTAARGSGAVLRSFGRARWTGSSRSPIRADG